MRLPIYAPRKKGVSGLSACCNRKMSKRRRLIATTASINDRSDQPKRRNSSGTVKEQQAQGTASAGVGIHTETCFQSSEVRRGSPASNAIRQTSGSMRRVRDRGRLSRRHWHIFPRVFWGGPACATGTGEKREQSVKHAGLINQSQSAEPAMRLQVDGKVRKRIDRITTEGVAAPTVQHCNRAGQFLAGANFGMN